MMVFTSVSFAILLLFGTPLSAAAFGQGSNHSPPAACHPMPLGPHFNPMSGGYNVKWCVETGSATVPIGTSSSGAPIFLNLQSMIITGNCELTGMLAGGMAGRSGQCRVLTIVNYISDSSGTVSTSTCQGTITLGGAPDLGGAAWVVVPEKDSELFLFYNMSVNDFRVGWSTTTQASIASGALGPTSAVCASFLFDGTSADLFVPAHAGHFNFSGVSTVGPAGFNFGTFVFYHANVTPISPQHHHHFGNRNDNN